MNGSDGGKRTARRGVGEEEPAERSEGREERSEGREERSEGQGERPERQGERPERQGERPERRGFEPEKRAAALPDPTGLELASRIARAARGGRVTPRRRARRELTEVDWSGAGPSARDPKTVGELFERVIEEKGWRPNLGVASLLGQWPRFVGVVNAQHTTPERFHDGELIVRAESTTWATAIRVLAPQLVARLNEAMGEETVTSVKVLGPAARSWKKGKRSVPGRGPRDTYG